jgi:TolB-like protein
VIKIPEFGARLRGGRVIWTVVIVLAVVLSALFGWRQWLLSDTRPTLGVAAIEATDSRIETRDLADHLGKRLRLLLARDAEIRVIEYGSSAHGSLDGMTPAEKARALGADYLLNGTLSGRNQNLRLSLQLTAVDGSLIWDDTFEGRVDDQQQLQGRVIDELWPRLPLGADSLDRSHAVLDSCAYPSNTIAILTLARSGRRGGDSATLAMVAAGHDDSSLLHLEKSRFYFDQIRDLPTARHPVTRSLGLQSLEFAARSCPDYPEIELLRLAHTDEMQLADGPAFVARHPNEAELYVALADLFLDAGENGEAKALAREALLLDPLGEDTGCRAREVLESVPPDETACR